MKKKHTIHIDTTACIGCGLCARDCVAGAVSIVNGKAVAPKRGCIACGHCEAICPQGAVTLTGFTDEPASFEEQVRLDPDTLMQAIRTRRSIRSFTEGDVSDEILAQIIEAGRLAPTGGNSQTTGYVVLGSRQAELEALAVGMFQKLLKTGKKVIPFLKNMEIDEHFFFKGAPLVIVITGNSVDASLAAENMAFMAEAHGLGVLFSGFFTTCTNHNRSIRKIMGLKRKEKAVTTLVIGYPAVKYKRTVRREPAKLRKL